MADYDVAQAHQRNSGSGIDDDDEVFDWRIVADRQRGRAQKDYRRGWQNGHADRLLGIAQMIAVSAPSTPYARGYACGMADRDPEY